MSIQWSRICIFAPRQSISNMIFILFCMIVSFLKFKLFTSLRIIKRCLSCYMGKFRCTLCGRNASPSFFFKLSDKISLLFWLLFGVFQILLFYHELQDSSEILQLHLYQFFKYLRSLECFSIVSVGYCLTFLISVKGIPLNMATNFK